MEKGFKVYVEVLLASNQEHLVSKKNKRSFSEWEESKNNHLSARQKCRSLNEKDDFPDISAGI